MMCRMPGVTALTLDTMRVCLEHHMNFDRTGYPEVDVEWGQATLSRIVAVADVFDAMTAHRAYARRAFSAFEGLQHLLGPTRVSFDPAVLFDPSAGVEYLLQQEYENVTLVGTESLNGRPNLHLRGTIEGTPLMKISANSLGLGAVTADLWADAETMRITQIGLVDPATDATSPTTWKIEFSDYDKAVDVRQPPGAQC